VSERANTRAHTNTMIYAHARARALVQPNGANETAQGRRDRRGRARVEGEREGGCTAAENEREAGASD
jgi:hypothetical protein